MTPNVIEISVESAPYCSVAPSTGEILPTVRIREGVSVKLLVLLNQTSCLLHLLPCSLFTPLGISRFTNVTELLTSLSGLSR